MKTLKKYEIVKLLSNLNDTGNRNVYFEQYSTDIDIVVDILYTAISDIYGKVVADLGCGNGIFSIGASLMNAKKVYCVEITDSIKIAIENAI
ncbi:MAG: 50S ribosomal protein L11 methyltransferase, partial [Thermoplasmata archaeon]